MIVYDIETYPNLFNIVAKRHGADEWWEFEVSPWLNQSREFIAWLDSLASTHTPMVGFNNVSFDYPVIHKIYQWQGAMTAFDIYKEAQRVIDVDKPWEARIRPLEEVVRQIDLYLIHHFDNAAKRTSLKVLEINMQSETVEDLPVPVGTVLNDEQRLLVKKYNRKDVLETDKFLAESMEHIDARTKLSARFGFDCTNFNDTKIGETYLFNRIKDVLHLTGKERTYRSEIALADAVLPWVKFEHPEFKRIHEYFMSRVITETKGVFKDLTATVGGITYVYGVGGIHASIDRQRVDSDEHFTIIDIDVKSFYPNLGIKNRFYPEHLGEVFCDVYEDIYKQRSVTPKTDVLNGMLKLALNGAYGKSNSEYSVFYDPLYTMKITLNGQLLLSMLAEWFQDIRDLQVIQANTDGITVRLHRSDVGRMKEIVAHWENMTGLEMEYAEYETMWIRDVNNYIAKYTNGKLKNKGAYEHTGLAWHKNFSQLVVPKVAEKVMVHGADALTELRNHANFYDFLIRTKSPRKCKLMWGDEQIQNTSRMYVSTQGRELYEIRPVKEGCVEGEYKRKNGLSDSLYHSIRDELIAEHGSVVWDARIHTTNKSVYEAGRASFCAGYLTTVVNDIKDAIQPINYNYYLNEVNKLVIT